MNAPRTSLFISLEGLSGVGKTETAELLASVNSCEFVHLTTDYASTKELMTRAEDVDARLCLFISAMLHKSVRIQDRLNQGISVVVDGFIARTLAYHKGMGADLSISFGSSTRYPDHSFMLTCDEETRRRRVSSRNRPKTIWDEIELRNIDRVRELYEQNNFPRIDTTNKSKGEVASEVLRKCGLPVPAQIMQGPFSDGGLN